MRIKKNSNNNKDNYIFQVSFFLFIYYLEVHEKQNT